MKVGRVANGDIVKVRGIIAPTHNRQTLDLRNSFSLLYLGLRKDC